MEEPVSFDADSRGSNPSRVSRACATSSSSTCTGGHSPGSASKPAIACSAALAMPTELALISATPSLRLWPRSQMPKSGVRQACDR